MTTLNDIYNKVLSQCVSFYNDLLHNDSEFQAKGNGDNSQLPLENMTELKSNLIIFNNSFLFREAITTSKSPNCLAITSFPPIEIDDVKIVAFSFNRDWIFLPPTAGNYPISNDIVDLIDKEIENLGDIIYILIGNVGLPTTLTGSIANNTAYTELTLDATIEDIELNRNVIRANPYLNDVILWDSVVQQSNLTHLELDDLRLKFFEAISKLRKDLISPLILPGVNSDLENTFLDQIMDSLQHEIRSYQNSLGKWMTDLSDEVNYNNVLRISYNFADDIVCILRFHSEQNSPQIG